MTRDVKISSAWHSWARDRGRDVGEVVAQTARTVTLRMTPEHHEEAVYDCETQIWIETEGAPPGERDYAQRRLCERALATLRALD